MNKIIIIIAIAFVAGLIANSSIAHATISEFFAGNSVDEPDRPSGFARYFTSGDIMNECLWDVIASDACRMGILFDNQENMNQKINWLMEQHGYKFTDKQITSKERTDIRNNGK